MVFLSFSLFACPVPMPEPTDDGGVTTVDAGCTGNTLPNATGACVEVGARCGEGFTRDDSGFGCVPVLATCAAGQLSVPGKPCIDVGWRTCPAGFTRSADGWSCDAVLPTTACTGATRAALGSTSCTPVGDCSATFPPAAATLFVDPTLTQPDATHFLTIGAAVAAAPAGATISIAPGTYAESLTLPRAVKLVGKCAAEVTLVGNPALFIDGVITADIEGLTVRDSLIALRVERGATVALRHAVLEANRRSAVQLLDVGTEVTLEDVVIRDTRVDPATSTFGQGIAASFGGGLTLRDVEVTGSKENGVFLDRDATHASLTRVVISDTLPRASTGRNGWGLGAQRGASFSATEVVITRSTTSGLVVSTAPSTATLRDVVVRETRPGIDNAGTPAALGVSISAGATATWTGGASEDAPGTLVHVADVNTQLTMESVSISRGRTMTGGINVGITVEDSARATLTAVAVREAATTGVRSVGGSVTAQALGVFNTAGSGLLAENGLLDGTDVVVSGHGDVGARSQDNGTLSLAACVVEHGSDVYGFGVQAALLLVDRCVVRDVVTAGLYARSAGTAALTNTVISDVKLDGAGEFGQGVIAEAGGRVTLTDVTVTDAHTAGLQAADDNSLITTERTLVRGTKPNGAGTRGRGANANFHGGLHATSTLFLDNQQVGVFAFQSRVDLVDSFIKGVKTDPGAAYGNGVEALTDGVIVMRGGGLSQCAGIAAVFAEGAGSMDGVRVFDNEIGLHAQDDSVLEELPTVPATLGPRQVVVSSSTVFEGNRAKLSGSTVPVPPP